MATGRSGFETMVVKVSIHPVRERATGFSNVKSIAYIALRLVDKVSPPQFRTQTYLLPSIPNPIRFHFKIAGLLESYTNYLIPPLTTFADSLKSHPTLFSNHVTLQA